MSLVVPLPPSIEPMFVAAGWRPMRREAVDLQGRPLAIFHAKQVTDEFGGLCVGAEGPGQAMATSRICFYREPQLLAAATRVRFWMQQLGPWVAVGQGHPDLLVCVDGSGRFYVHLLPNLSLHLLGPSFGPAMEVLLLGLELSEPIPDDTERPL